MVAFRKFGLRIDVIIVKSASTTEKSCTKGRFNDGRRTKKVDVKMPNLATADSPLGGTEYIGEQNKVDTGKGSLRGHHFDAQGGGF